MLIMCGRQSNSGLEAKKESLARESAISQMGSFLPAVGALCRKTPLFAGKSKIPKWVRLVILYFSSGGFWLEVLGGVFLGREESGSA
jgi:hypothetical protein